MLLSLLADSDMRGESKSSRWLFRLQMIDCVELMLARGANITVGKWVNWEGHKNALQAATLRKNDYIIGLLLGNSCGGSQMQR
jgi:hypothetical protein